MHADQRTARECYVASLKVKPTRRLYTMSPHDKSPRRRERSTEIHSRYRHPEEHMVALVDLDPRLEAAHMEAGEDL